MQMGSSDVSALRAEADRGEDRASRPASRAIKWDIASQWDKDAECPPSLPPFETKIVLVAGAAGSLSSFIQGLMSMKAAHISPSGSPSLAIRLAHS